MTILSRGWPLSSILLALASTILLGIGIYFIAFRPTFLAEDVRYMQLTAADLSLIEPSLAPWLAQVFRVLGGYAAATGLLGLTLAATAFRVRHPAALLGALTAGVVSIGLMATVNVAIDSDFKLPLVLLAGLWLASIVTSILEGRASRRPPSQTQGTLR